MLDEPVKPPSAARWLGLALPAALITLLATFVMRGQAVRETVRYTLQGIALGPLFICAIRWPESPIFRWLNERTVRFVGTLSYSLYLVHHVVLTVLEHDTHLSRLPRVAAGLVISIAISWTIYVLVEKPCAKLRKRLSTVE